MTREQILKDYKVDANGIIRSLGKFEGEMLYAPYFYDVLLDGHGDYVYDQDGDDEAEGDLIYVRLDILPEDRAEFPELDPATTAVLVYESGGGFVHVEEV